MLAGVSSAIRATLLTCLLLLILMIPALADTPSAGSETKGTLTGSVVDRDGSLPVVGAILDLVQGSKIVASTKTDSSGSFTFPAVPAGVYFRSEEHTSELQSHVNLV